MREGWFLRTSSLHGVRHTQRVHIHAQRLTSELGWGGPDVRLALTAALWHDIGRTNDDVDPSHGAASATRAVALGLADDLAAAEGEAVLFAIHCHSLSDQAAVERAERLSLALRLAEPERALRILWLLKDADALDRVRLADFEAADPAQLRRPEAVALIPFAAELYRTVGH